MNVGSSTAATSTTSTQQTAAAASQTKVQEKSGASFDEEMKNVNAETSKEADTPQETETKAQNNETAEKQDDKTSAKEETTLLSGNVEVEEPEVQLNTAELLSVNIQQLLETQNQLTNKSEIFNVKISQTEDLTKSIGETLNFQNLQMSENDAQFFVDLVKNNNAGVQNVVQDVQQAMTYGTEEVQKSAQVSKTLINALANTQKTGQAVRIDFGNDVAVVMRVGKDGAIMANFIPGDKAVEEYLKNNIGFLKQRFEEEDIPYSRLSYSQHEGQERRDRQENNDKENKHE